MNFTKFRDKAAFVQWLEQNQSLTFTQKESLYCPLAKFANEVCGAKYALVGLIHVALCDSPTQYKLEYWQKIFVINFDSIKLEANRFPTGQNALVVMKGLL